MAAPRASAPGSLVRVETLYEITRQFASSLELEEVLGKVLSLTVKATGADAGSIFQLDANGCVTRSILARGELPARVKRPIVAAVMREGLAGWVYRHREAALIADTRKDDRWHVFPDDVLVTRSAMAVPLLRQDEVIGIMTMMHAEANRFSPDHLELLQAIAAQAAVAIENATLYTRAASERLLLRTVIASVKDAILVTDASDRLVLVNPAARTTLGLADDVDGAPIREVLDEPELLALYASSAEGRDGAAEVTLRDGRILDCALVRLPDGGRVLGMHDITTLKRLDALKSEFVAQVAHDLRAPLGVIHGNAWLLADLPALGDEERGFVQDIIAAIGRMRTLIDGVLDVRRIEMGIESEFAPVELGSVLREAYASVESAARQKDIGLTLEIAEPLPRVNGSAVRLVQAVTNLASNAIKFTPPEGSVRLEAAAEDDQVVVRVRDTGPGIPAALQHKLFRKFSRLGESATKDNEGNGLGLAIVKSLVDAHGGRVWVESRVGEGSTFAFSLPRADARAA